MDCRRARAASKSQECPGCGGNGVRHGVRVVLPDAPPPKALAPSPS